MKFISDTKKVEDLQHKLSRLSEIERGLLSFLNEPLSFSEMFVGFKFKYLDCSEPDQSDVALALVQLIDAGLVDVVNKEK